VKAEIQARIDAEATPEALARETGLAWPLTAPVKTVAEVNEAIKAAVEKEVTRRYAGADDMGRLGAEAQAKYRVYKVGERVSFRTMAPLGKDAPVEGMLIAVSEAKIHVGNRWINRNDVPEEVQARFYPELASRAADRYVKTRLAQVRQAREAYAAAGYRKLTPAFFRDAGYALHPDTGAWTAATEIVDLLRARKIEAIATDVCTARGYVLKDGKWVKKTLIDKLADAKAAATAKMAERRAAREKAAQAARAADRDKDKDAWGNENDDEDVWGDDE
jgi:hypothetical protein